MVIIAQNVYIVNEEFGIISDKKPCGKNRKFAFYDEESERKMYKKESPRKKRLVSPRHFYYSVWLRYLCI